MNTKLITGTKVLVLLTLSSGLISCDGNGPEGVDEGPDLGVFASKQIFDAAMTKSGTAQGSAFSGTYTVVFSHGRFSKDCTVDFVRAADFYVNDSAPDAEISKLLNEVQPSYDVTVQVQQQDGRITLDADGDGIEGSLSGWIDADGTFQVVAGMYQDARNHWAAYHSGRIQGQKIDGAFVARATFHDNAAVDGSCTWSAEISPSE